MISKVIEFLGNAIIGAFILLVVFFLASVLIPVILFAATLVLAQPIFAILIPLGVIGLAMIGRTTKFLD